MPPDMPAAKLRPGGADHHHDAAGHVFAAVVAGAFDHRDGAGIAHREALARDAAEIAFALDRAVQHGVADDDGFLGDELPRLARRIDDDAPAREALADVVVGLAFELERHALGEPGAEALPGRALEPHVDGVVGQPGMAVAPGDLARQHGAGGAVGALDREVEPHRRAAIERRLRRRDQLAVEHLVEPVILRLGVIDRDAFGRVRLVEQAREVEPLAFQCSTTARLSSICICPTISSNRR